MAGQQKIRGVEDFQEMMAAANVRDPRPTATKIIDWLKVPNNLASVVFFIGAIAWFVPAIADICLALAGLLFWFGMTRSETLPLKFPMQSAVIDANEPDAAKPGKFSKAKGIFFLGNEVRSGKEVWLTNSDCRQHFLLLGTTGTGKTESLLGFASNAVSWGSGCLFIDGKGDVNTFASFYALARRFGREDDVLVMNYMTGNTDVGAGGGVLLSNTMNPFSHGASDTLTNMIVSLMDDVGGDGAMWKGRATSMLTGLMRALIWLRDNNRIDLNVGEIRDHMNLKRIIDLCDPSKYPDLPIHIRANIKSYLLSLPGFQEEKGYKQAQTTLDQHGYLEMQFTRILGSLADVYGHIFKTPFGEIDMNDVVLNRRLLLIMLPALEKSSDEIANLGKIVVATLRGMMGSTLGSAIEGAWQDIVENRLTKSPSPFIVILDEVGYYMVDGMDLMAAQARSLGFSLVFAGQDLNAMKRISEKVFGSVLGNTRTKVLLGTEDTETMELASKLGGKSLRTHMSGYSGETGEFGKSYSDNMEARIEEVERIHGLDIKAQGPGEAHIMFADKLVRVNMFYPAPNTTLNPRKLTLRTNHFITVGHPNVEAILSQQRLPDIVEKLCDPDFAKMMRHDADNAVKNLALSGELEPFHAAITEGRTKTQAINGALDLYCAGFAQIVTDTDNMSADYHQQVPGNNSAAALSNMPNADFTLDQSGDARRPRNIENPQTGAVPPTRQANAAASPRRPAEATSFDGDVVPANLAPAPPRRSDNKPFKSQRVDGKVRHGVNVDGNVHDMVDKLPAVPGVLDALAALDADGSISSKKEIDDALNDAIRFADDGDDLGFLGPATQGDIKKAEDSTQKVMPDFEFEDEGEVEGDNDGDGDGKDGSTMDFLTSLIETEGA
jgi:intracellular multiplication protein IcmO